MIVNSKLSTMYNKVFGHYLIEWDEQNLSQVQQKSSAVKRYNPRRLQMNHASYTLHRDLL